MAIQLDRVRSQRRQALSETAQRRESRWTLRESAAERLHQSIEAAGSSPGSAGDDGSRAADGFVFDQRPVMDGLEAEVIGFGEFTVRPKSLAAFEVFMHAVHQAVAPNVVAMAALGSIEIRMPGRIVQPRRNRM